MKNEVIIYGDSVEPVVTNAQNIVFEINGSRLQIKFWEATRFQVFKWHLWLMYKGIKTKACMVLVRLLQATRKVLALK